MAISEFSSFFFLSTQAAPAPGGGMSPFITIGLLFLGMWFLVIAPQRKRQKEHDAMLTALQTGDEVVTSGGIYGTITNVKEDRFVVRIADNTKIEIGKNFVSSKVSSDA
ncbi:MAG: preprotein translocase subunit YajC [Opitutaceae bacterium]